MNPIQGWIALVKTPANARKLLKMFDRLPQAKFSDITVYGVDGLPTTIMRQRVPAMCPTQLLYGAKESEKLYLNEKFRPALDAWDTGVITKEYLTKLCFGIIGDSNAQKR